MTNPSETGGSPQRWRPSTQATGEDSWGAVKIITPTAQRLLPKLRHWNLHVQWVHAHDWSENSAVLAYTKRYI